MEPAGICVISSVLGSALPPQQTSVLRGARRRRRCLHAPGETTQVGAKAPEELPRQRPACAWAASCSGGSRAERWPPLAALCPAGGRSLGEQECEEQPVIMLSAFWKARPPLSLLSKRLLCRPRSFLSLFGLDLSCPHLSEFLLSSPSFVLDPTDDLLWNSREG